MSNFLIATNEMNTYSHYKDYARNLQAVREYLENRFKKPFFLSNASTTEWGRFYEDYCEDRPDLQFLTLLVETLEEKLIYTKEEKDGSEEVILKPPFNNALYYYPAYEVAIGCIHKFQEEGVKSSEYVFFADEEKYVAFYKESRERQQELDEREIILYTDGPNGVERDRKKVNRLIDREQVVLDKQVKEDIYQSVDQFFKENQEFYARYNIPHKRGILLYGSPGNGKTTLVKSLVGSIDAPVAYWQVNEYTTSRSVNAVFDQAVKRQPMVLVIEDLDSFPAAARSTFLNVLDGATTEEGIFLIGTTNYPERVDAALINRVGRFDRTYEIQAPTQELRREYLLMRGMLNFVSEADVAAIAESTGGFSFVQMGEIFRSVAYAGYHGEPIRWRETVDALKENNRKTKTQKWSEAQGTSVGFA